MIIILLILKINFYKLFSTLLFLQIKMQQNLLHLQRMLVPSLFEIQDKKMLFLLIILIIDGNNLLHSYILDSIMNLIEF